MSKCAQSLSFCTQVIISSPYICILLTKNMLNLYVHDKPPKRPLFTHFSGSVRKYPKTSNFNSANRELSIEVQFVPVVIVEPKLLKEALKRGLFYAFFRNYAVGSVRKNPETSNFNSANRELSIEVQFVTVV